MQGYGILLAAIGAGSVAGTFLLPWLRARMDADGLVLTGTVGTAVMSVFNKLAHKSPSGFLLPVDGSDAGMRGGGRALSDG
jgi:hypothetical protein